MTKQHFIEFAKQIRAMRQEAAATKAENPVLAAAVEREAQACSDLVTKVAGMFNPRFDAFRFSEATDPNFNAP